MRRLNDPYPLPVCWEPADPDLVEDWVRLVRLAPPVPSLWAAGPDALAGGGELADVLDKVPTGRLVVNIASERVHGRKDAGAGHEPRPPARSGAAELDGISYRQLERV